MSVRIPMNDNLYMCNSDVGNQDLCVTSTFRIYMYRRVHPWVTGQAHSEGTRGGE
jgi:hypothetical protein